MGKDEYYARVEQLTEGAMERLSRLTPSVADFVLAHYRAIREAAEAHLSGEERTSLTNLSFFYFLATCIDFLFFLHLRHRNVNIYEHELEHILSVMITHARHQKDALPGPPDPQALPTLSALPETLAPDWEQIARELRGDPEGPGGVGERGSAT
ncbi:MAG: hypothetical protein HY726_22820 [Candidatus Rokubacteria bacterium]|nr:hypothetical protein [Candidatus Rokubacteria bacterium]